MNPNPISSLCSCASAFIFFMTPGLSLRLSGLAGSPASASCGLPAGAAAPGTADLAAPPSHGRPMRPRAAAVTVEDPGHCTIHDDETTSTVLRCIKFTGGLYLESARVNLRTLTRSQPEDHCPSLDSTTSATPLGGRCARLQVCGPLPCQCRRATVLNPDTPGSIRVSS
jgi:hypothetical protein